MELKWRVATKMINFVANVVLGLVVESVRSEKALGDKSDLHDDQLHLVNLDVPLYRSTNSHGTLRDRPPRPSSEVAKRGKRTWPPVVCRKLHNCYKPVPTSGHHKSPDAHVTSGESKQTRSTLHLSC